MKKWGVCALGLAAVSAFCAAEVPFKGPVCSGVWKTINEGHKLVYLEGDRLLDWEPASGDYRVWRYDRTRTGRQDPLPGDPISWGNWAGIGRGHQLIYLGGDRLLDWVAATGQYRIWRFDRTKRGEQNPLGSAPQVEGTWTSINAGHALVYLGGDAVLDWIPATGEYRIWNYDREVTGKDDPFPGQPLARGAWKSVGPGHHMVQFNGDHVLNWQDTGHFRVWLYDLTKQGNEDPLPGKVAEGDWKHVGPATEFVALEGDLLLEWNSQTGAYSIWDYEQRGAACNTHESVEIPAARFRTAQQDAEFEKARREAIAQAQEDIKNEIEFERIQQELAELRAKKQQDDAAVRRARDEAQKKYEVEKAKRELAKARQEQALARQRAIAMTRQGVVQLHSPITTSAQYVPIVCRWKLWDGSYTAWAQAKIPDKRIWFFHCAGGMSFQVKFSSAGGGEKNYTLEVNQMPSDVTATADDGFPYTFYWAQKNALDLFKGKPKK